MIPSPTFNKDALEVDEIFAFIKKSQSNKDMGCTQ